MSSIFNILSHKFNFIKTITCNFLVPSTFQSLFMDGTGAEGAPHVWGLFVDGRGIGGWSSRGRGGQLSVYKGVAKSPCHKWGARRIRKLLIYNDLLTIGTVVN